MKAVVIALDRLSSWSLGCYGNEEEVRTPHFDRLAAESVVFDWHFGENFDPTACNHAWWTGCHQFSRTPEQQAACPRVTDILRAANVETWLIRESSETELASGTGLVSGESGFDHVRELDAASDDEDFRSQSHDAIHQWASNRQTAGLLWWQNAGDGAGGKDVAGGKTEESAASGEDDSVTMLDRRLGILLDCLDEMAAGNLLTIVTAAAGSWTKGQSDFLSGERPLGEERVHTPLLIRDSNRQDGGSRLQSLAQTIDLPLTLLDWFNAAHSLSDSEGRSLLPLLHSELTDVHECLFLGDGNGNVAIRTADWSLVGRTQRADESGPIQLIEPGRLFVKPDDVWDIHDVAAQAPQAAARLTERLETFLKKFDPPA